MARRTAGDRPMARQSRLRVAVTVETEAVESRLDTCFEVRSDGAAMATHTGIPAGPIRVVVVAFETVDRAVLAVREIERDRDGALEDRFAEREARSATEESRESHRRQRN